ncbi:MAG: cytochrome c [Chitinophagaceae bacterium]|nr:cytochrome c [Chitinophagaceae bacterium]
MGIQEGCAGDASVRLVNGRYLAVAIPPSADHRKFTVTLWRGPAEQMPRFKAAVKSVAIRIPVFRKGGDRHWPGEVYTRGEIVPDTAAFVADILTLPVPNPWKRNVRVIDMAFLDNTTAVVSTFEGDVWVVKGVGENLGKMSWKRFASGLYEPMSVEVHDGNIYVFGKEGIVRLHDLNGDGEADYYENFCDLMQEPPESYAWAADMVFSEKDSSFIIALGGAVNARPGVTKPIMTGFRAGSNHSGTIMRISLDGKRTEIVATGFRMPFLGINSLTGGITATDQQGNYVSSTPVYVVEQGDFMGVPATAHRDDTPIAKKPLTWIPHRIDRSAGSQIWMISGKMGPLNGSLIHFSFGKPGLFRVMFDSTSQGWQGGVAPIPTMLSTPILKGVLGPVDGYLYMTGFNLLGSSSEGVSAVQRLRYTGKPSYMPNGITIGKQGIVLSFDSVLDTASLKDISHYHVKRWNYQNTEQYGSGHFRLDGEPGEEMLPVLGAYPSADRRQILLLIPDMKEVDQMELIYRLNEENGRELSDGIWFSVNHVPDLRGISAEFTGVDFGRLKISEADMVALIKTEEPITRERGAKLFKSVGCIGCHSPGTETAGKYGPPFKGVYGTLQEMNDGSFIKADEGYLRESILDPSKHVVKGYEAEMPSYVGVLSDADIQAILLYIMYLKY